MSMAVCIARGGGRKQPQVGSYREAAEVFSMGFGVPASYAITARLRIPLATAGASEEVGQREKTEE